MQAKSSKSLAIALASIIVLGTFSATTANADTKAGVSFGVTINSDVRDHRKPKTEVRDHRSPQVTVRDHRSPKNKVEIRDHRSQSKVVVRDHRSPQRKNTVVVVAPQYRYTCNSGALKLRKMGYRNIAINDCSAPVYNYTAMDGASIFRAKMNARSGQMQIKFVGIAN